MSTTKNRQVKEIVMCGKDPVYFLNKYTKIQHPTRGLIPFETFDFQDTTLDDFRQHRFNIVLKSRQLGISTLTACYAVWLACFYKDKNVLVIATKLAVAQNFIKKVKKRTIWGIGSFNFFIWYFFFFRCCYRII